MLIFALTNKDFSLLRQRLELATDRWVKLSTAASKRLKESPGQRFSVLSSARRPSWLCSS